MKAIKKIMVAVLLSLSMVVSFMPTNVFAAEVPTFSGGNGTQEDPWLISSSNDLIELADWVNSEKAKTFDMDDCGTGYFHGYYFKQISNIDLTGVDYAPIGYTDTDEIYFSGNYDGNNFIISNITSTGKQDSDGQTTVGIFGFIVEAKIENIHVKNADFLAIGNNSYAHAGGIVGVAYDSSIKNCFVENSTIESKRNPSQNNCAGGIAGYCAGGTFEKCISNNNIINSQCYGGGFVGEIDDDYPGLGESSFEDCAVVNCKVTTAAENTRNYSFSGGFVGEVNSDGVNVKNSFVYKTNIFAHDNGDLTNAGVFAGNLYENSYADYYSKLITMNCYYGECGSVSDNTFTASSKSKEEFENGIVAGLLGDSFVQNGSSITLKTYPADYTKVNEAKAKVPSDLSIYTDESVNALKDALALVEDGKNITEQATVDGYADAINKAIEGLVKKPIIYKVIEGEGGTFVKKSGKDISIRIDHEYTENVKVEVDGKEVDKVHYKVTKGSTIITFDDMYLNTLAVGTHHVKVTFKDGSATTTLIIKEQTKDNNEKKDTISNNQEIVKAENKQEVKKVNTGDNTNIVGITLLLVGSLIVLIYLNKKKTA
ncbi:hypothetical protein GT484_08420 [Coprobacillus sp. BIOML-A1]|nr:hypothetical protein [Coprobacillus sp. BIOML-A1]